MQAGALLPESMAHLFPAVALATLLSLLDLAASQVTVLLQLDWLVNLVEAIDRLLEAVVDLLRTVSRLFGGGD